MKGILIVIVLVAGCGPPALVSTDCIVTPTTTMVANGHTLIGKGDGDVFFYLGSADRVLRTVAVRPEKLLIFFRRLPDPLPDFLKVDGENRTTGTRRSFEAQRHLSEFGTEWGANFGFPDAGCWQLTLAAGTGHDSVVLKVE